MQALKLLLPFEIENNWKTSIKFPRRLERLTKNALTFLKVSTNNKKNKNIGKKILLAAKKPYKVWPTFKTTKLTKIKEKSPKPGENAAVGAQKLKNWPFHLEIRAYISFSTLSTHKSTKDSWGPKLTLFDSRVLPVYIVSKVMEKVLEKYYK